MRRRVGGLLLLAGIVAGCGPAPSAGAPEPGRESAGFVVKQGEALVATERFQRDGGRLQGELLVPNQVRVAYTQRFGDDGAVTEVEAKVYRPNTPQDARPAQESRGRFDGGRVRVETRTGDTSRDTTVTTRPGAVFYMNPSFAMVEQILRRARAIGGRRVDVPVFLSSANGRTENATVRFRRDSALVSLGGVELQLRTDGAGRILSGAVPEQHVTVIRTNPDSAVSP